MVEGLVGFGFDVHLERRLAFVNANGDKSRHKKPPESNLSLSSSKTVAHARPQYEQTRSAGQRVSFLATPSTPCAMRLLHWRNPNRQSRERRVNAALLYAIAPSKSSVEPISLNLSRRQRARFLREDERSVCPSGRRIEAASCVSIA